MTDDKRHPIQKTAAGAVGAGWWYFLLRGLLLLGAGIFLIKPELSAVALVQLLGIVLVEGLITAAAGIAGQAESRFWAIVRGVLMVLVGLFVFLQPALLANLAVTTGMFFIAPFVVIDGILEITASLRGREEEAWPCSSSLPSSATCAIASRNEPAPILKCRMATFLWICWNLARPAFDTRNTVVFTGPRTTIRL